MQGHRPAATSLDRGRAASSKPQPGRRRVHSAQRCHILSIRSQAQTPCHAAQPWNIVDPFAGAARLLLRLLRPSLAAAKQIRDLFQGRSYVNGAPHSLKDAALTLWSARHIEKAALDSCYRRLQEQSAVFLMR